MTEKSCSNCGWQEGLTCFNPDRQCVKSLLGVTPGWKPKGQTKGQKYDQGKPDLAILRHLKHSLQAVAGVMQAGALKYEEGGFLEVPNALRRYESAMLRHWLEDPAAVVEDMQEYTQKTGLPITHDMAVAVNALFKLEVRLRQQAD